jgi:heptosyltransferase-2
MRKENILIWLPSPIGDAILATPALRAIRSHFSDAAITFLSTPTIRQTLTPTDLADVWMDITSNNIFKLAKQISRPGFDKAILLKNSFGSALACFKAGIKTRIGYSRDGRGFFLTDKLYPPKLPNRKFKPQSMIDYYMAIAFMLGADTSNRNLELQTAQPDIDEINGKFPDMVNTANPVVIFVPGGAFGPSKCWPAERFARTADWLIENHNAKVIVSVAPNDAEKKIAKQICDSSKNDLINLADNPLTMGRLKALFSFADLVICNDTGPRHIATALGKKVITMYGPNDPVWTQTGYENEVHVIGKAICAPCLKPHCDKEKHFCMESISVERICTIADKMLKKQDFSTLSDDIPQYEQISKAVFVEKDHAPDFQKLGLTKIDDIFKFEFGTDLKKKNLANYRSRVKFKLNDNSPDLYLKRYTKPPLDVQLDKCLSNHWPITCGMFECIATDRLNKAGINTAKIIAFGSETDLIFENRSFTITQQVPDAVSLEQKLPCCFEEPNTKENIIKRRNFIKKLAEFVKRFHDTGFRHRDLYLCHIFCNTNEEFTLIDLARTFKPVLLADRFQIKDITQLFYSAPAKYFSRTDRLRFYKTYTGKKKLDGNDEVVIEAVLNRAKKMAAHDKKHGRIVPYRDIK